MGGVEVYGEGSSFGGFEGSVVDSGGVIVGDLGFLFTRFRALESISWGHEFVFRAVVDAAFGINIVGSGEVEGSGNSKDGN